MPKLSNNRHELFAQQIAEGASQREAYINAGYTCENEAAIDASASRLLSDVKVQDRVAELQEEAAALTAATIAKLTRRLLKIADKAETADDAPTLSVARATLMDIAKLNGLITDKSKVDLNAQFDVRAWMLQASEGDGE